MIQKKYLLLIVAVTVLIAVVGFAIYLSYKNDNDKYTLVEESSKETTQEDTVKLDASAYPSILNDTEKKEITDSILKRTSYDTKKIKTATGIIRKESLEMPSEFEQTFIVDVKEIQTSYLVSLYKNPDEGTNIINLLCTPKEQQIYSKDYCYET